MHDRTDPRPVPAPTSAAAAFFRELGADLAALAVDIFRDVRALAVELAGGEIR